MRQREDQATDGKDRRSGFAFYDTTKSQVCDIIFKMEDCIDAKNINS